MNNNLRVILAKKRMSVSDLKREIGVSRTTLTEFYYERSKPNIDTLQKIAKALNVTIDELLTVEE